VVALNLALPQKVDPTHKELNYSKLKEKNLSEYDNLSEKEKIIFLAGVFDGEGSFGYWSQGKGKKKQLQVKVETTDSDMVARFQEFFGGLFYVLEKRQKHFKHTFRWKMVGERSWKPLKTMIPYMCQRRREKFYGLVKPSEYGSKNGSSHLQKQTRLEETDVRCSKTACTEDGFGGN
jgi:hypothetical protein